MKMSNNTAAADKRLSDGFKSAAKVMAAVVLGMMFLSMLALAVVPTFVGSAQPSGVQVK